MITGDTTWVALARGINVGGKNRVAMGALRTALEARGFRDVATYLQSGNVVLTGGGDERSVRSELEGVFADDFGVETPVIIRRPADFAAALEATPYESGDPTFVHIVFLDSEPDPTATAALDADRSPPDTFEVIGREIHVHYPRGSARSKLTVDYFDRVLGTVGTARNMNTVRKVAAMLEPQDTPPEGRDGGGHSLPPPQG